MQTLDPDLGTQYDNYTSLAFNFPLLLLRICRSPRRISFEHLIGQHTKRGNVIDSRACLKCRCHLTLRVGAFYWPETRNGNVIDLSACLRCRCHITIRVANSTYVTKIGYLSYTVFILRLFWDYKPRARASTHSAWSCTAAVPTPRTVSAACSARNARTGT